MRNSRRATPLALVLASCLLAGGSLDAGSVTTARKAALSTASPLATRAGLLILQSGGTAADAAVAVALALAVVHPQAGNLGGGGSLLYFEASTGSVWTLDFGEVAPGSATRDMFAENAAGARTGAQAAAIPGTVAGLDALHQKFGARPWKELLAPAILLAREGTRVDAELLADLEAARRERKIDQFPATASTYYTGKPVLAQAQLLATLERLAAAGARDFYQGETGRTLVTAVRANGGSFGLRDLRDYKPVWRAPMQFALAGYDVYTVPPPSGGGLVIGQTLNILSGLEMSMAGLQSARSVHLFAEAQRRAYYDRNRHAGDPARTRIPYRELLSAHRAEQWRRSIDPNRVTLTQSLTEPAPQPEGEHTTHFTIADALGNVASVTTSLGENFGSGFLVPGLGFFLNNAMDDFTTRAGRANRDGLVQGNANVIAPGRRMASSLTPTIVLRDGKPYLALGTRGGPAIPTTITQILLSVLVHGSSLQDAVNAPRWHQQAEPEELEYERTRAPQATIDALNVMGHGVRAREFIGDVHAILFRGGTLTAVADPRRGGSAGGY